MYKRDLNKIINLVLIMLIVFYVGIVSNKTYAEAATFPTINVEFDEDDQSVIVSGIPAKDESGNTDYMLKGYLNYGDERVETFSYAPSAYPYHIADKQAYIFNWSDAEFLLPCSGEYQFTAYLVCGTTNGEETGPKTTIDIILTKKDESTNWGPGLPNTTVESYDLKQIQGKDKTIKIEEPNYTWTINGKDIVSIPDISNLSLKVTADPEEFANEGVEAFFGDKLVLRLNVEHSGELGFTAVLDYKIGAEFVGKYANLFYVKGDGTFEYICGDLVDEGGVATFQFTHASDYVVAVTDVEYTGQELNPKPTPEPIVTPEPTLEPTSTPESTNIPETIVGLETTEDSGNMQDFTSELYDGNELREDSDPVMASSLNGNWLLLGGIAIVVLAVIVFIVLRNKK